MKFVIQAELTSKMQDLDLQANEEDLKLKTDAKIKNICRGEDDLNK